MRSRFRAVLFGLLVVSCGGARNPPPRCPEGPSAGADPRPSPATPAGATPARPRTYVTIAVRPEPSPAAHVHVELRAAGKLSPTLRLTTGAAADVTALTARDGSGAISAAVADVGGGVTVTLARVPTGELSVAYDVKATADARAVTSALVVADDRFRGLGEAFVLLPTSLENEKAELTVTIDGAAIRAPNAASSFGLGASRMREAQGRALVRSAYLAGSLGVASFADAVDTDHAAWLGYTAFDPRPAAAEVAQIRTALRERWHGGGDEAFGLLFVSTPRPSGAYAMLPRAGSVLVHLGPDEPWSPAMRVNLTQHLMHAWLGGELRLAAGEGAPAAETTWFHEGVARHLGARLLEQLGFMKPEAALDYTTGLLAVQATSPHHGKSNSAVAALAQKDAGARALLVARGALYAQRLAARIHTRSSGARTLESGVVLPLLDGARDGHSIVLTAAALDAALAREAGPDEPKERAAWLAGKDVVLPETSLGPCFRARAGQYAAFDLGFDLDATLDSPTRAITGLVVGGTAASAGLAEGDTLDDAAYKEGRADVPVKLSVSRGGKRTTLTYLPRGPRRPGQAFERVRAVADAACGPIL